jgi:hypothetical protein
LDIPQAHQLGLIEEAKLDIRVLEVNFRRGNVGTAAFDGVSPPSFAVSADLNKLLLIFIGVGLNVTIFNGR